MAQGISHFKPEIVLDLNIDSVFADILDSEKGAGPFSDAIQLSLWEAVGVIAKLIVDHTPVNLGHLSGAISQATDVYFGEGVWYGEVGDGGIPYSIPVEYGRNPGKQPPVDDLKLWVLRKQLQWYRKTKTKQVPMTVDQMAWALAKHIEKEGTEGAFMFKKGLESAKPYVDQIWENLMDDLERMWGGK